MDIIKNLTNAIGAMDKEILRDTLAYLLKVYVIDQGHSFEGIMNTQLNPLHTGKTPLTFVELIRELKNQYSMDELNSFSVEGENVFISLEGRKYQLTGDKTAKSSVHNSEIKKTGTSGKETFKNNGLSPSGRFEKLELE